MDVPDKVKLKFSKQSFVTLLYCIIFDSKDNDGYFLIDFKCLFLNALSKFVLKKLEMSMT